MQQKQVFLYLKVLSYSFYYRGLEIFLTDFTLAVSLSPTIPQQ
jgi:hypothetical protein